MAKCRPKRLWQRSGKASYYVWNKSIRHNKRGRWLHQGTGDGQETQDNLSCICLQIDVPIESHEEQFMNELQQLRFRIAELESQLKLDDKTPLLNTTGFNEAILNTWNTAKRTGEHVALLHIDIDRMSVANEHYGEDYVDENILYPVGEVIAKHTRRASDAAGRLFGDAFRVVLYAADINGATTRAQAIINDIAALQIPNKGMGDGAIVTVTTGFDSVKSGDSHTDLKELQRRVSRAMYRAKGAGRNQAKAA